MLVKVLFFGHLFTQEFFSISYSFYINASSSWPLRTQG